MTFPSALVIGAFLEGRLSYRTAVRLFERHLALGAIERTGSRKEAARLMHTDAKTLYRITHWKLDRAKIPDGLIRKFKKQKTKAVSRHPKKRR